MVQKWVRPIKNGVKVESQDGKIYANGLEVCEELETGEPCGVMNSSYVVTDIEDTLEPANNYCYGYKRDIMKKEKWENFHEILATSQG